MNNTICIIGLAAALVCSGPLHAQDCSGGPAGGTDATGNQCNAASEPAARLMPTEAPSPRLAAKMVARPAAETTALRGQPAATQPSAKITAVAVASSSTAAPTDRLREAANPVVAAVATSKVQAGSGPECSGGAHGGMDATGNQCNVPLPDDVKDRSVLALRTR
jgi:hypothetical protein